MSFYSVRQSLRSAFYVPSITSAQKFIDDRTFMSGRNPILFSRLQHDPSTVNRTRLNSIETRCNGFINMVVKFLRYTNFHESQGEIDALFIISRVSASGYILWFILRSLSDVSYSDECRTKKAFDYA